MLIHAILRGFSYCDTNLRIYIYNYFCKYNVERVYTDGV